MGIWKYVPASRAQRVDGTRLFRSYEKAVSIFSVSGVIQKVEGLGILVLSIPANANIAPEVQGMLVESFLEE